MKASSRDKHLLQCYRFQIPQEHHRDIGPILNE
jgi:hypothetical protein